MLREVKCSACHAESREWLCDACIDELERVLVGEEGSGDDGLLGDLLDIETTTLVRQDRLTRASARTGGDSTPAVANPRAAAVLDVIRSDLHRWHFVLVLGDPADPDQAVREIARSLQTVRRRGSSGAFLRWARRARVTLAEIADIPPERRYVGPCKDCGRDLWALEDQTDINCRCAESQPILVDQRLWELRQLMDDRNATAPEIAAFLSAYGARVAVSTVYAWAKKDLIHPRAHTADGTALFNMGEVRRQVEVLEEKRRRAAERAAAR